MTAVHELLKQYIIDSGLITGYKMQMYQWVDTGVSGDKFVVIMPDGGLPIIAELGREHYVMLMLVGAKNDMKTLMDLAVNLINYVSENPENECLDYVENRSTVPKPLFTEDNRMVIQLNYRIVSSF